MNEKPWGQSVHINLHGCSELITDEAAIHNFSLTLCSFIKMVPFGGPRIVWFGSGRVEGYSLVQLIHTSSIVAHFSKEHNNSAFIDIFSCKYFDARAAAKFCASFFEAQDHNFKEIERD